MLREAKATRGVLFLGHDGAEVGNGWSGLSRVSSTMDLVILGPEKGDLIYLQHTPPGRQ